MSKRKEYKSHRNNKTTRNETNFQSIHTLWKKEHIYRNDLGISIPLWYVIFCHTICQIENISPTETMRLHVMIQIVETLTKTYRVC